MITYVNNFKPLSLQAKPKRIQGYKQKIKEDFIEKYGVVTPIQGYCYAKILYIVEERVQDIDNIIKPLLDSFNEIIYPDDKNINKVEAIAIPTNDYGKIEFDYTHIDSTTINLITNYIEQKSENIVYCEFGDFNLNMIKIGDEYE